VDSRPKRQASSQAVRYLRGEDHVRIAADATPSEVRQWAEDWYNLWALEVCHADKSERRVERFILCCSRLAVIAELHKLNPKPLLTFIREVGVASFSGRIPTRSDSHVDKAQGVVERVESWAKGQIVQAEAAKARSQDGASRPPASKPKRTRRPSRARKPRPLTPRQTEVVQIVGECKGDIAEAARRLGKNRKTVEEAYRAGMTKLGKTVYHSKGKTRLLARDRRGQENISEGDDQRRQ
jgi:DNA-binding CsgD family transcriptional regulator